jgi:hypothetical protein
MANVNLNEKESISQKKQILAYLKTGKSLTQLEALHRFGCMRLASRINDLRNDGWGILTESIKLGSGKIVACYRIPATNVK